MFYITFFWTENKRPKKSRWLAKVISTTGVPMLKIVAIDTNKFVK